MLLNDKVMTAGIIVVKYAALMGVLPICTHTAATEVYFPDGRLLVDKGDVAVATELLTAYWRDAVARRERAEQVRAHVLEHHSPEHYAAIIGATIEGSRRA